MKNHLDLSQVDWLAVLPAFKVPKQYLTNRHGPCPICGAGKDRFRFDNKGNRGTFICNRCGAGSGVRLIHLATGLPVPDILRELSQGRYTAVLSDKARKDIASNNCFSPAIAQKNRARLNRVWNQGRLLTGDDPASHYLCYRVPGLDLKAVNPYALRYHPGLDYISLDDDGKPVRQGTYPVLLAKVADGKGVPVSIHRTYLTETGRKAPVAHAKKLMSGIKKLGGAAIRLTDIPDCPKLAVCEGIETGLAVLAAHLAQGRPVNVWSLLNCGNLAKADIPAGRFTQVCIYADNDAPGIRHALLLQKRLREAGFRHVQCRMPAVAGQDFADVWKLG